MNRFLIPAHVVVGALCVAASRADFMVEFTPDGGTVPTITPIPTPGPGIYNLDLPNPNDGTYVVYSTDPANEGIAQLRFTGSTSGRDIDLIIGRPGTTYQPFGLQSPSAFAVASWYNGGSTILQVGGANVRVQANVQDKMGILGAQTVGNIRAGVLAGNITSSSAETIGIIDCDATTLSGPRIESLNGSIFIVNCGDLGAGTGDFIGDVIASNGSITTVQAGRFLIGDISAGTSIGTIRSGLGYGGAIVSGGPVTTIDIGEYFGRGLDGSTVVLASASLTTGGAVNTFVVAEDLIGSVSIGGNITTEFTVGGGIYALDATGTTIVSADLEITGRVLPDSTVSTSSVLAASGFPHVSLVGTIGNTSAESMTLEGDILVGGLTMTGVMQPGDLLNLNRSLPAGTSITLPAGGLAGQIIVNADNVGAAWNGDVVVRQPSPPDIVLAPNYTQTHTALGGGAAGLVPFNLHGTDSSPLDSESVAYASRPGPASSIQVRHYGLIAITGDGLDAITFDADSGAGSATQTGCVTSVSVGLDDTVLVVTPEARLLNGYTYTITTIRDDPSNRVECDLGLSTISLIARRSAPLHQSPRGCALGAGCLRRARSLPTPATARIRGTRPHQCLPGHRGTLGIDLPNADTRADTRRSSRSRTGQRRSTAGL